MFKPQIAKITVSKNTVTAKEKFTVTVTLWDEEINATDLKYAKSTNTELFASKNGGII